MNSSNPEGIKMPLFKLNLPTQDKVQKYLVYVLAAYMVMLFTTIICMMYQNHHAGLSTSLTNQRSKTILVQMNTLRDQLRRMDFNQNPENIKATISTLTNELAGIEKNLSNTAKQPDVEKINQHIVALQSDFNDLENIIVSQFNQKKYLDAKALPFQVSYLDMISGQPFVSVNYENHVTPLGIGDKLTGWTLASADYEGQTAEFSNGQGQYIKVTLAS